MLNASVACHHSRVYINAVNIIIDNVLSKMNYKKNVFKNRYSQTLGNILSLVLLNKIPHISLMRTLLEC